MLAAQGLPGLKEILERPLLTCHYTQQCNACAAELLLLFFNNLKLELLAQFPASNYQKYIL